MITAWPKPQVWRETLAGLDFLTCIDLNFTADCSYADLVLPAATWYEIESYMTYGPIFRVRERVMNPEDRLLLGLDMLKSPDLLEAAYNDRRVQQKHLAKPEPLFESRLQYGG